MQKLTLRRRESGGSRKRLSYPHVVATLALFLAIGGGTALAARRYLITSTNQIKPTVLRSLHGSRGPQGSLGYRGYRGYKGATGAAGVAGATGPGGSATTTGFPSTLPAGKTELGTWGGDVGASSSSPYYSAVSFEIPLAAKPVVTFVAVGAASTAACPGSVAKPQAASGNLCVYEAHLSGVALSALDPDVDGGSTGADVYGTLITLTGAPGYAFGTWAVTA
jgi:hypothetical protein